MKCFLLTWTEANIFDRHTLVRYLDESNDVKSWLSSTGGIFIASDKSQIVLAKDIHARFPKMNFLVVPVEIEDVAGWTDKVTWEFIRRPRQSPLRYEEAASILKAYGCQPAQEEPSLWWRSKSLGDFYLHIEADHVDEAQLRLIEADLQRQQRKVAS